MGMSTRIGRKVVKNTCKCLVIDRDNNTTYQDVIIYGDYSDPIRAQNACRKKLKSKRVLVESMECEVNYYSMPIETFIKNADQISTTEKQETN